MRPVLAHVAALALAAALAVAPAFAQGFKFSEQPDEEKAEREARENRIAVQLSTPCRADLKNKKIMVVIGEERSDGYLVAQQQNYGPHYEAINRRLRSLGLRTFTPEEIRRQIAQAEVDAVMRNDPDAALSAQKRLGASFVLRGLIRSQASANRVMAVNQVSITMGFTLAGSDGRPVSSADARAESYAGADVGRMAQTLVEEQADVVVAKLYSDYCRNAGLGAPVAPKKK
ncbi:MAG TPA: hypothetical protein VII68_17600 [Casimicrobiaceae bacterium]|jgi:hypothetical protein